MIRTFEDLFEKMKADGHNPQCLMVIYEEHQYWKGPSEKDPGANNLNAYVRLQMCRENLLGYLSCLQDVAYICQSEYDGLWDSLRISGDPEEGENHG